MWLLIYLWTKKKKTKMKDYFVSLLAFCSNVFFKNGQRSPESFSRTEE